MHTLYALCIHFMLYAYTLCMQLFTETQVYCLLFKKQTKMPHKERDLLSNTENLSSNLLDTDIRFILKLYFACNFLALFPF